MGALLAYVDRGNIPARLLREISGAIWDGIRAHVGTVRRAQRREALPGQGEPA